MGGKFGAPDKMIIGGKRLDGRKPDELRPITIKAGVIPSADGSAEITQGETKIVVAVYGPREVFPKHMSIADRACVECRYDMASFSTPERSRPGMSRRSTEISKIMAEALMPAIYLEKYPKTKIDIYVEVTNANAGTRCAAITAASVALADAGIEMRDMVVAVASGKVDGKLVLDMFEIEDNFGSADLPLAYMLRKGEITLLQMDGELTKEEIQELVEMNIEACKKIYAMQKKALQDKYSVEKKAMPDAGEENGN
ncbi:MAG TPA: exosome complex exonuclease Rrp41 [Nanoarchaeota archaeon]|nr:exosome complex exonuclease Rrp41 [Nanoarchaeota archaeon]